MNSNYIYNIFVEEEIKKNFEINITKWCISAFGGEYKNKKVFAGGLLTESADTAYFELLERAALVDFTEAPSDQSYKVCTPDRKKESWLTKDQILQNEVGTNESVYSKSNAVAIHKDLDLAIKNCKFEMIERDVILRSWFGLLKPQYIHDVLDFKLNGYHLELYAFLEEGPYQVVTLIGVPTDITKPFIHSFGCADNLALAFQKSKNEFLQRLGFLYEEEIPKQDPEFSATPFYHQEFYLYTENFKFINRWLCGEFYFKNTKPLPDPKGIQFVDITPDWLTNDFHVVKAISTDHMPLIFGKYLNASVFGGIDHGFVHPIA